MLVHIGAVEFVTIKLMMPLVWASICCRMTTQTLDRSETQKEHGGTACNGNHNSSVCTSSNEIVTGYHIGFRRSGTRKVRNSSGCIDLTQQP